MIKQDATHHFCKKIYGLCFHVCADDNNNLYCCYCGKRLLITQIAEKWINDIKQRRKKW